MLAEPLAVTLSAAAEAVGMSTRQFRRVFLDTQRLRSIHTGERDRIIDCAELRAAYEKYVAETRDQLKEAHQ